jgi:hypothetical protein
MQRTTPAPHNVMPLAIAFTCSSERLRVFGYHVLVPRKVATVMPLLGLALPLIASVRRQHENILVSPNRLYCGLL